MPVVSVTQPSDGQTADANDVNSQVNAILAVLNGHVDQDNLADAGVTNAKLAGSIDVTKLAANVGAGWTPGLATPNTITALGNRSYSVVFNSTDLTSTVSNGMRLKLTRTVAAPTQCTSLNGSTQYYSRASASLGSTMTFTNNFVVSAWVKLTAYGVAIIASRYNGTSGWALNVQASGQVQLTGINAGAANFKAITSYQSIPLNKWVHIATQLDMTSTTNSPTVNYVMIDGVDVPAVQTSGGTAPTALIQAGNLEIGSWNGGALPFPGKIAQVAIYSAKVPEATILASMPQTLAGTETSLISAYSLNNSINDLNANANNLTANGSAVATATDSPFGNSGVSSTLEYGIITANAFSTNTTLTVQVPEGCAIPTSGGVSAVSYSTQAVPYRFPRQRGKWMISSLMKAQASQASAVSTTWYNLGSQQLSVPIGDWMLGYDSNPIISATSSTNLYQTLSTANNSDVDDTFTSEIQFNATGQIAAKNYIRRPVSLAAQASYYLNSSQRNGTSVTITNLDNTNNVTPLCLIEAELATL